MEKEIWKDVVGFEGLYKVNNKGKVYSLLSNKILSPAIGTSGYYTLNLFKCKKAKSIMIHKIIAMAFLGHNPTSRKIVIDHIDNNKLNNDVSNIQIISNRHNSMKDKNPKSGFSNIYLNSGAYLVRMRVKGVKKTIGTFKNIEDAIIARNEFIEKETN